MNSPTPRISARPKRSVYVKVRYDDQVKRISGTGAREDNGPGSLVVYDGLEIVARFWDGVEKWWIQEAD
jgi:hypothetical protein